MATVDSGALSDGRSARLCLLRVLPRSPRALPSYHPRDEAGNSPLPTPSWPWWRTLPALSSHTRPNYCIDAPLCLGPDYRHSMLMHFIFKKILTYSTSFVGPLYNIYRLISLKIYVANKNTFCFCSEEQIREIFLPMGQPSRRCLPQNDTADQKTLIQILIINASTYSKFDHGSEVENSNINKHSSLLKQLLTIFNFVSKS